MSNDSRRQPKRSGVPAEPADPRAVSGVERLSNDAIDLINRALFEEWLQRHGSWDAFLKSAGRDKSKPEEPPTKH